MISVFYIDENRSAERADCCGEFKWAVLDQGAPEAGRWTRSYYQYNGVWRRCPRGNLACETLIAEVMKSSFCSGVCRVFGGTGAKGAGGCSLKTVYINETYLDVIENWQWRPEYGKHKLVIYFNHLWQKHKDLCCLVRSVPTVIDQPNDFPVVHVTF